MESWLCQIAKNIYYSYLRKKKGQEPAERECAEHDFVHKLEEKDTAKAVLKVLHELPEPYREVFYLHVFGEVALVEIAEIVWEITKLGGGYLLQGKTENQ